GALSAYGILASDIVRDYSKTVVWTVAGDVPDAGLRREFARLEKRAHAEFKSEGWRGKPVIERSVDVRYQGQGYELNVPWSGDFLDRFHAEHKRRYGYSHPQREVELVTLRVRGSIPVKKPRMSRPETRPGAALRSKVCFDRWLTTTVLERSSLEVRKKYYGPAVITEYSGTTFIPPGMNFRLDGPGNLLIEVAPRSWPPRG